MFNEYGQVVSHCGLIIGVKDDDPTWDIVTNNISGMEEESRALVKLERWSTCWVGVSMYDDGEMDFKQRFVV